MASPDRTLPGRALAEASLSPDAATVIAAVCPERCAVYRRRVVCICSAFAGLRGKESKGSTAAPQHHGIRALSSERPTRGERREFTEGELTEEIRS